MNSIIRKLRIYKYRFKLNKILNYDRKKYLKNCCLPPEISNQKESLERDMLVYSHTIEKGLSHLKIKPLFGYEIVQKLLRISLDYFHLPDYNEFYLKMSISILCLYNEVNSNIGITQDKLPQVPKDLYKYNIFSVGAKETNKEEFFRESNSNFFDFSNSRHSVRLYDSKSLDIDKNQIEQCIELAMNSPSACNRQAINTIVVLDKEMIRKICEIQQGSKIFGENAGALILIKADLNFYHINERKIPIFDSGLFTMNLLYSLHFYKLGACVLNASLNEKQQKALEKIIFLKESDLLTAIIAVSNIPNDENFKVAKSIKKEVKDIVEYID